MKSYIALALVLAGLLVISPAHAASTSQAPNVCAGAVLDAPEGSLRLLTDVEIAATEVLLNEANTNPLGGAATAPCTKSVVVQKACSLVTYVYDVDNNVIDADTHFNYAAKSQIKCVGKGGKTTNTFFSAEFTA